MAAKKKAAKKTRRTGSAPSRAKKSAAPPRRNTTEQFGANGAPNAPLTLDTREHVRREVTQAKIAVDEVRQMLTPTGELNDGVNGIALHRRLNDAYDILDHIDARFRQHHDQG